MWLGGCDFLDRTRISSNSQRAAAACGPGARNARSIVMPGECREWKSSLQWFVRQVNDGKGCSLLGKKRGFAVASRVAGRCRARRRWQGNNVDCMRCAYSISLSSPEVPRDDRAFFDACIGSGLADACALDRTGLRLWLPSNSRSKALVLRSREARGIGAAAAAAAAAPCCCDGRRDPRSPLPEPPADAAAAACGSDADDCSPCESDVGCGGGALTLARLRTVCFVVSGESTSSRPPPPPEGGAEGGAPKRDGRLEPPAEAEAAVPCGIEPLCEKLGLNEPRLAGSIDAGNDRSASSS